MLGSRLRRRPNNNPALGRCIVFAGSHVIDHYFRSVIRVNGSGISVATTIASHARDAVFKSQ